MRFLLGAFEAGMLPGVAVSFLPRLAGTVTQQLCSQYYLSRWYRKSELVFRLSLYLVASPLAGAFGGLLASGILRIDSIGTVRRWEMIFLIEVRALSSSILAFSLTLSVQGIITVGLGIIAYFFLTDSPSVASWLTPEEKHLAEERYVHLFLLSGSLAYSLS